MSTRARIGISLSDGGVLSIYLHNDGSPDGAGAILANNYTDVESVRELIDGGDISSLWATHDWEGNQLPNPRPLYYTERGETEVEPRHSLEVEEFLDLADQSWADFAYAFDPQTQTWSGWGIGERESMDMSLLIANQQLVG